MVEFNVEVFCPAGLLDEIWRSRSGSQANHRVLKHFPGPRAGVHCHGLDLLAGVEVRAFLLEEDVYHHWRVERGIPQAISTMVHYTVLLVGLFVALAVLGVDLTKITILAGAFTVGIGFGLQTVINNFVCGLILLFGRPVKVGDVVQVDADIGEVQRIGIRACVIRTADGSEIILPNGTLISNKVKNWTFSDQYRAVEVQVSVDPQRVVEILKHVAADHPSIVKEPPPQAYAVNFASGTVSFQLRAWTDRSGDWIQVRSDLSVAIDDALTQQDIAIAQPWDGAPTVADVHILGTPHPTGRIARALWGSTASGAGETRRDPWAIAVPSCHLGVSG